MVDNKMYNQNQYILDLIYKKDKSKREVRTLKTYINSATYEVLKDLIDN
jgi:hypothetical protein